MAVPMPNAEQTKRSRLPWATLLLIVANLGAAFAAALAPEVLETFAFSPKTPTLAAAVGHVFFHANLFHLLGNMVFLAAVGVAVELATGVLRYLSAYFAGGFLGLLAHALALRNSENPASLLGASACVAGCVGYYASRYLSLRVPLAPKVAAPMSVVIAIWAGLQLLGATVRIGQGDLAVSFWAHLGGLVGGLIMSAIFRAPDLAQVEFSHEALDRMNERGPAAAAAAAKQILKERPEDLVALQSLAEASRTLNHEADEMEALHKIVKLGEGEVVDSAVIRLSSLKGLSAIPAMERFKLAGTLQSRASEALLRSLLGDKAANRPEVLLALAGLLRESNPQESGMLLDELSKDFSLDSAAEVARKRGWIL